MIKNADVHLSFPLHLVQNKKIETGLMGEIPLTHDVFQSIYRLRLLADSMQDLLDEPHPPSSPIPDGWWLREEERVKELKKKLHWLDSNSALPPRPTGEKAALSAPTDLESEGWTYFSPRLFFHSEGFYLRCVNKSATELLVSDLLSYYPLDKLNLLYENEATYPASLERFAHRYPEELANLIEKGWSLDFPGQGEDLPDLLAGLSIEDLTPLLNHENEALRQAVEKRVASTQ